MLAIVAQKFGRLVPLHKESGRMWICQCDCGNQKSVRIDHLRSGAISSCGCLMRESIRNREFTGCHDLSGQHWSWILADAKRRDIPMYLTILEAHDLFQKQCSACPYTGKIMSLGSPTKKNIDRTASLDRIDSNLPYYIDNCEWIIKPLNQMKRSLSKEEFIYLASRVARKKLEKTSSYFLGITGDTWGAIRYSALRSGKAFNVTKEWAYDTLIAQRGCCALSGVQLAMPRTVHEKLSGVRTASLDRIDSKVGYVVGNCQWVHKNINYMKRDLKQDIFIDICRQIALFAKQDMSISKERLGSYQR